MNISVIGFDGILSAIAVYVGWKNALMRVWKTRHENEDTRAPKEQRG